MLSKDEIIVGMCYTMRHDFGLEKEVGDILGSGMTAIDRRALRRDMITLFDHHVDELYNKAVLYEKLRKLNAQQFAELYQQSITTGTPFDELVAKLGEQNEDQSRNSRTIEARVLYRDV